jgi:hypothetical protein
MTRAESMCLLPGGDFLRQAVMQRAEPKTFALLQIIAVSACGLTFSSGALVQ